MLPVESEATSVVGAHSMFFYGVVMLLSGVALVAIPSIHWAHGVEFCHNPVAVCFGQNAGCCYRH
jgi:hypothetical protein